VTSEMFLETLRVELDEIDSETARLMMSGLAERGDKGEIARLLGVLPSRITLAIERIRNVYTRTRSR
jgi:hypothetical protein